MPVAQVRRCTSRCAVVAMLVCPAAFRKGGRTTKRRSSLGTSRTKSCAAVAFTTRSSLNSQRNLAQMVLSKRLVCLARFFQPKCSVHVNFKRTRIDQGVESVDEGRAVLYIVRFNCDTVRSSRLRHYD